MELIALVLTPLLFLGVVAAMLVVSQAAGYFTFVRYHNRQRASNHLLFGYIQGLAVAKASLSRRTLELQRLSAGLARSNRQLEDLNRLKTRFMSMAAHDVRTPLATIQSAAELLAGHDLEARDRRILEGILLAAGNVRRLLGDLTDLSVIEAGKLRVERGPLQADLLIADAAAALGPAAEAKGIALTVAGAGPGATLVGDRFRLGQVLANLIGNALKFTPEGGRVELRAVAAGGGVLFTVGDTGPGIDPAERRRVFEKFYQSRHADPQAARKGWGLGLSIAQEIVFAHQGDIGVESRGLGRGARFWFFIPSQPIAPGRRARAPRALLPMAGLLLALLAAGARAQSAPQVIPLDEKARYDRFLEDKVENVLMKMLGPNRSKVVVDATLDFTRVEKFEMTAGAVKDQATGSAYSWEGLKTSGGNARELLPGIPVESSDSPAVPADTAKSYERSFSFPSSFVKKLSVSVIVDNSLSTEEIDSVERIVTNLLDLDPKRGDALAVLKARFAPAWKTIWYAQDSFAMIVRYAVLSLLTLLTLIVVAACFLKLSNAIEEMARAQSQQYALDVGMKPSPGDAALADTAPLPALEPPEEEAAQPEAAGDVIDEALLIDVKPEKAPELAQLIGDEDPENVALVCAYLPAPTRQKLISSLPQDRQALILRELSSVRFVEPELIGKIKAEIEHRLSGAVGGMPRVFELIDAAPPALQRELLAQVEGQDPELYARLRSRVLFFEDLVALSDEEWGLLIGRTRIDAWAVALSGAPQALMEAVRKQVLPQTWEIVEQLTEGSPPTPDRLEKSQGQILNEARELIASGRIRHPAKQDQAPVEAPAAGG